MRIKKELYFFSNINCDVIVNFYKVNGKFSKIYNNSIDQLSYALENEKGIDKHIIIIPLIENILSISELRKGKYKIIDKFIKNITNYLFVKSILLISPITINYLSDNDPNLKNSIDHFNLQFDNKIYRKFSNFNNFHYVSYKDLNLNLHNLKYWYIGKILFDSIAIKKLFLIHKKIDLYHEGKSIKLIITDLDNTLWGGVIGDDDYGSIKIGGHDPIGEAYFHFQLLLKNLKDSGILLAICSKNDLLTVKKFFDFRPDMPLKLEDFVSVEANWNSKSKNINKILKQINILPNSSVFIDDNPLERDEVSNKIKKINIPNFPENIFEINKLLDPYTFESPKKMTFEDQNRLLMISQEKYRDIDKQKFKNNNLWLSSLNTKVIIMKLDQSNLDRAEQLYRKVNQFNSTTRRLNFKQILNESKKNTFLLSQVSDKFGETGIVSLINYSNVNKTIIINDFIMSCRIVGRKIENIFFNLIIKEAIKKKYNKIYIKFNRSKKNNPMYSLLSSNFNKGEDNNFYLNISLKSLRSFPIKIFKSIKVR